MTDTAGKSGKYIVNQQPTFAEGTYTPRATSDELSDLSDGSGRKFANNRIRFDIAEDVTREQVEEIARYINGEVIEYLPIIGMVAVKVSKNTEEGLKAICEDIEKKYPNIIEYTGLEIFRPFKFDSVDTLNNTDTQNNNPTANNTQDDNATVIHYTNDPWWGLNVTHDAHKGYIHWGISSINAQGAWEKYKVNPKHNIRVGIIERKDR